LNWVKSKYALALWCHPPKRFQVRKGLEAKKRNVHLANGTIKKKHA